MPASLTFVARVRYFLLMDPVAKLALIVGLVSSSFMLNVPMGFLRTFTKKFSFAWFLCVHTTIPVIYFGRMFSHLETIYVPIFIAAAIAGQIMGGKMGLHTPDTGTVS